MAAKKEEQKTQLVLHVITGTGSSGKAITKARTFSAVNPAISDDDMLDIGAALGNLQSHALSTIQRIDKANLYLAE